MSEPSDYMVWRQEQAERNRRYRQEDVERDRHGWRQELGHIARANVRKVVLATVLGAVLGAVLSIVIGNILVLWFL